MKKLIVFILAILISLSACADNKSVQVEYRNSKVNGLLRPVLLEESTFRSIYQLDSNLILEDMVLIEYSQKSKTDAKYNKTSQEDILDFLSLLFEMEIQKSSMASSVTVNNYSEFELVFNETIGDDTRNYSVEIGQSYLLVYLAGETNSILMHELTNEQFEQLKSLLSREFDD